jgi:hypothetical protein
LTIFWTFIFVTFKVKHSILKIYCQAYAFEIKKY